MVKFAKVIIDKQNNIYRNLHFLPDILNLMQKYREYMYDDYFESEDLAEDLISLIEQSGSFFWVIVDDNGQDLVAIVYFDKFIGNKNRIHSVEINTCFRRKYWGNPVREISKKFIKYSFEKYGFQKIKASVFAQNKSVKRLLKYLGFKREGYFKSETIKNGGLQDIEVYSKIRSNKKCKQKK